jgi:hypothetical protein
LFRRLSTSFYAIDRSKRRPQKRDLVEEAKKYTATKEGRDLG